MSLIVKPISAIISKDLDSFSKMDPYVKIRIGGQQQKSSTHRDGGKRPQWSDTLQFQAGDSIMTVEVYDQDTFKDDLIGTGSYNLAQLYNRSNQPEQQYLNLMNKGQTFGRLLVSIEYRGGNQGYQALNQGANQFAQKQPNTQWGNNQGTNQWNQPQTNTQWQQPQSQWQQPQYSQPQYNQAQYNQPQSQWNQPQSAQFNQPPTIPLAQGVNQYNVNTQIYGNSMGLEKIISPNVNLNNNGWGDSVPGSTYGTNNNSYGTNSNSYGSANNSYGSNNGW